MPNQSTSALTPGLPLLLVDNEDGTYSLSVAGQLDVGNVEIDNSGVESRLDAISDQLPPTLGQQTVANSVSTALATEQAATLGSIAGISVPAHDYVALGYTGDNLTTVVYKTGGSGGTTVATLTLAYTGARLDSVTRS